MFRSGWSVAHHCTTDGACQSWNRLYKVSRYTIQQRTDYWIWWRLSCVSRWSRNWDGAKKHWSSQLFMSKAKNPIRLVVSALPGFQDLNCWWSKCEGAYKRRCCKVESYDEDWDPCCATSWFLGGYYSSQQHNCTAPKSFGDVRETKEATLKSTEHAQ